MSSGAILEKLKEFGIIPVLRLSSAELAARAVGALYAAGFRTFEVTLSIPDAVSLIQELSREDVLIGAGTVLSAADGERCLEAGAEYIVSPCIIADLPKLCAEAGACSILSGLTPTEVFTAFTLGADAVKVFPAGSVGGPAHIKALKAVFPEVALVPTGGVSLDNLTAYFQAGAAFVGVGSELFSKSALEAGRFEEVTESARRYLEALHAR